jgi:MFS family permease
MALAGVGAGINELTALAATSELAPTAKRGKYVAVLIFTILPFCPSVLWSQLIAYHSSWRYVGLFCALWSFVGLVMTAVFYFPPPRVNSTGLTNREIIERIDFVGGFLSIVGMILFIAGLLWGGYQVIPVSSPFKFQPSNNLYSTPGNPPTPSSPFSSELPSSSASSSGKYTAPNGPCSLPA